MNTLKHIVLTILALCMAGLSISASPYRRSVEPPPNIVLFLVDDMGWQDTSVPFWTKTTALNRFYKTPNMEKLAAQGVKFTRAYAAPVCSPTRISLMTGMNAARHRVTNWTLSKNATNDAPSSILEFPLWNVNGMSPQNTERAIQARPLPQILKDNGYFTIHAGKAHFGAIGTPAENPINIGFEINIAGHAAGGPGSYLGTENFGNKKEVPSVWGVPGLEAYHGKNIFLTEALTQEALKALDNRPKNKPFFLYMAHYAVHVPIYGDQRFVQKYIDQGADEKEAKYASMVEGMDKSLGDLMSYLENNNLAQNTVILFMSDNGGLSVEGRGGSPNTHNKPLASGKGSLLEGGIREPMILKWPGRVTPNTTNSNYLIIEDFFPTILKIAKIKAYKTIQTIDGEDFIPLLKSTKPQTRPLFWHFPNSWGPKGPGIGSMSSVVQGDWKLLYYHENQTFQLFNLTDDIGEQQDLSKSHPAKLKGLAKILAQHLKSVQAQMPTYKATGKPVPFPSDVLN